MSTSGCPVGSTFGPCNEWHEMMCTSCGRCLSNAAFSGALTDVCPEMMEPILAAASWVNVGEILRSTSLTLISYLHQLTWTVLCYDLIHSSSLD